MQNSTFFQTQLSRISQSGGLGTLVYLGAGKAGPDTVKACLDSGAEHILLTEADPERAAALRPACIAAGVQLREAAVADEAGERPFHIFNIRALSSCCRPDGLEKVFPGLRQTDTVQVKAEPVTSLLDMPEQTGPGCSLLAIDCPGQEAAIIRQLQASGLLSKFQHLYLSLPAAPLYEGSEPMAEILQRLHTAGWRLRHTENQDPDFPACFLEQEPLVLQIADLEKQLAETSAAQHASELRSAGLDAEARRQAQALEQAAAERDSARAEAAALAAKAADQDAEAARQAQALEQAIAERDSARAEAAALAAKAADQDAEAARQAQALEQAAAERDSARAEAAALAAKAADQDAEARRQAQALEQAIAERDSARAEAAALAAKAADHDAEAARQAQALEQAAAREAETRKAQQNLAVALRLQSQREADLKELQARYSALLQRQEAQDDLLHRTKACLAYLVEEAPSEEAGLVLAEAAAAPARLKEGQST
ncbi:hypothetical protein K3555_21515 (plasmid) [Leisingera sp. M527]|uniref:hypothetical protein n=1 Tax=Leisingera sp. M527 TaxID=2867014 RepID=UPI0021A307F5|nr:hypothetical protein [Leisingera sp. M527]UWQ35143.1 hypothetical protein K3555_21515 [Leisingera sp. M527]